MNGRGLCGAGLTFSVRLSGHTVQDLVPCGRRIPVTFANARRFAQLAAKARLSESLRQIDAVRAGLGDVVPVSALKLFTWRELEQRVCGKPTVDIPLLRRHTVFGSGVEQGAKYIENFWRVLADFSQEERRRFVKFAWGQERLPATDAEFKQSRVRMLIKDSRLQRGVPCDNAFPRADTCFFNIELPRYSSQEVMRRQLTTVINMDWGLDGDDVDLHEDF